MPGSRSIIAGVLLIVTLISGVIVSVTSTPYNAVLFNVYKLLALSATILFGMAAYQMQHGVPMKPVVAVSLVVTATLDIALFASGAVLSIQKEPASIILLVHRVSSVPMAISSGVTMAILIRGE